MIIPKNKFCIGIIGPKPYFLGGHDSDNPTRDATIVTINQIVSDLAAQYDNLVGLTGLDLGTDQDFARICIKNEVPYYCYLSHESQEKLWGGLGDQVLETWNELLLKAKSCISIAEGNFSPKKVSSRKMAIINSSNVIIYVKPKGLIEDEDIYLKQIKDLGKTVYLIKV